MASTLKTKLFINFTICGVNLFLGTDVSNYKKGVDDQEGGENDLSKKVFVGNTKGLNISLSDIIEYLLTKLTGDIEGLKELIPNILVKDIYALYDGNTKEVDLIGLTRSAGKEVRFFFNYKAGDKKDPKAGDKKDSVPKSNWALGIQTDLTNLGDLPMVGEQLKEVSLSNVGFIFTSGIGPWSIPVLEDTKDGKRIKNTSVDKGGATKSTKNTKKYGVGFNFVGELKLPLEKEPFPLILPLNTSQEKVNKINRNSASATNGNPLINDEGIRPALGSKSLANQYKPAAIWFDLNKKLGPVSVDKVGFAYGENKLSLLISGNIGMAGLVLSLEGLTLSFDPALLFKGEFSSSANLLGIGLSYQKGPLKLSGMFEKVIPKPNEEIAFYGSAQIATSKFSISGIGAYSRLKEGNRISFFVYAMYKGPIGGPAFFFVTGVAAGFGYNRIIRVPSIQQVRDFPLVAMAFDPPPKADAKENLNAVLDTLITGDWIPASAGDYWLAIGIRFQSFKIIDSFVLLTVQFGTKLEFAILGLSVLKWPQSGNTIAYVELAIMARFGPDSDVIAVDAMLTHNSWIFNQNCKLTGGFAFYAWVSGEHEGDFVITLGGYHPKYKVPAHYPKVERLALNWKVNDIVSIHGEMYYALTPTAIMAGGRWEVSCDLSFIKASVTVWANMIISWAPFYYELEAGIIVRIEANIKILFIHIHFSLQMGAMLRIQGPPFGGEVYVDWTIFSFTIPFGAGKQLPEPLKWGEFADQFIPRKDKVENLNPLDTRISNGIIREHKSNGKTYLIVNPYDIQIDVESFIPSTMIQIPIPGSNPTQLNTLNSENNFFTEISEETLTQRADSDLYVKYGSRKKDIGIRAMEVNKLDSTLKIWLSKGDFVQDMSLVCQTKGVADALWGIGPAIHTDIPETKVLSNTVTGVQLHPKTSSRHPPSFSMKLENFGFSDFQPALPLKLINVNEAVKSDIGKEEIRDALNKAGFGLLQKNEIVPHNNNKKTIKKLLGQPI